MAGSEVRFHRLAMREYVEAFDIYAHISSELANAFENEIEKAVNRIGDNPERWPAFGRSFHWVRTRRFPYVLYYQIVGDHVEVLAVSHGRRRLGYWKKRRFY